VVVARAHGIGVARILSRGCTFSCQNSWRPFFSRRPKDRQNIPPNLTRPAKTVLKITLALAGGCTSCPGVHLHILPVNYAWKIFFHRPGGCRCTHYTPGYAYGVRYYRYNESQAYASSGGASQFSDDSGFLKLVSLIVNHFMYCLYRTRHVSCSFSTLVQLRLMTTWRVTKSHFLTTLIVFCEFVVTRRRFTATSAMAQIQGITRNRMRAGELTENCRLQHGDLIIWCVTAATADALSVKFSVKLVLKRLHLCSRLQFRRNDTRNGFFAPCIYIYIHR